MYKFGVLGGSGAFATAHLLKKIFEIAVKKYGAHEDNQFPYVVVINSPLDGINHEGKGRDNSYSVLLKHTRELISIGCSHISIACNTHHQHYQQLSDTIKKESPHIIIINIIELLSNYIYKHYPENNHFTIMCSQKSNELQLHKNYFKDKQLFYPQKTSQEILNHIIKKVISNSQDEQTQYIYHMVQETLKISHPDTILISSCTELSVLTGKSHYPVIDTLDILADYINLINISFK